MPDLWTPRGRRSPEQLEEPEGVYSRWMATLRELDRRGLRHEARSVIEGNPDSMRLVAAIFAARRGDLEGYLGAIAPIIARSASEQPEGLGAYHIIQCSTKYVAAELDYVIDDDAFVELLAAIMGEDDDEDDGGDTLDR